MNDTSDSNTERFTVEWGHEVSADELRRLADELENTAAIDSLRLEVATTQPEYLLSVLSQFGIDGGDGERPTQETLNETESNVEEPEAGDGKETNEEEATDAEERDAEDVAEGEETDEAEAAEDIPRLHLGGTPFQVMRILDTEGGWLRTEQIQEAIPDDWDIDDENVGSALYNLADRALVEKRPYEEDKRKSEYRITDLGEQAVDRTLERAEEQEQSDEIEPMSEEDLAVPGDD